MRSNETATHLPVNLNKSYDSRKVGISELRNYEINRSAPKTFLNK